MSVRSLFGVDGFSQIDGDEFFAVSQVDVTIRKCGVGPGDAASAIELVGGGFDDVGA